RRPGGAHGRGPLPCAPVASPATGAGPVPPRLGAYLVVEQASGHPSFKVEAPPDRPLRPPAATETPIQPAAVVAALGVCAIAEGIPRRSSSALRTRLRPSALAW